MTLSNNNCETIEVTSTILDDVIANPGDYLRVEVESTVNCCTEVFEVELEPGDVVGWNITPALYGLESFIDGIYKVKIRAVKTDNSWAEEENCFFLDCETKCKVATFVTAFLSHDVEEKEEALYVTMIHYALINASNCGCNCAELCNLYFELSEILASRTPLTNQNICSTC